MIVLRNITWQLLTSGIGVKILRLQAMKMKKTESEFPITDLNVIMTS